MSDSDDFAIAPLAPHRQFESLPDETQDVVEQLKSHYQKLIPLLITAIEAEGPTGKEFNSLSYKLETASRQWRKLSGVDLASLTHAEACKALIAVEMDIVRTRRLSALEKEKAGEQANKGLGSPVDVITEPLPSGRRKESPILKLAKARRAKGKS